MILREVSEMLRFNRKGQNTAEYAILLALVIGGVVAMQTYVKRSWQGGVKFALDNFKSTNASTGQYEPYYLETASTVTQQPYKDTSEMKAAGAVDRVIGVTGNEHKVDRGGYQKIQDTTAAD